MSKADMEINEAIRRWKEDKAMMDAFDDKVIDDVDQEVMEENKRLSDEYGIRWDDSDISDVIELYDSVEAAIKGYEAYADGHPATLYKVIPISKLEMVYQAKVTPLNN